MSPDRQNIFLGKVSYQEPGNEATTRGNHLA